MSFRKLVQFGDNLQEGIALFTPFEEEEDYQDMVEPNIIPLNYQDGVYRGRGYEQSRKIQKVVSKRFVLYDKDLSELIVKQNNKNICNGEICKPATKESYLSDFIDWIYRGLRGGVKRLYMVTEDGSLRWTWAEAVSIPYQKSFGDAKTWQAFIVEFMIHDPYWYEVGDGATFLYEKDRMPLSSLVCSCASYSLDPSMQISKDYKYCTDCEYQGVIIQNDDMRGFVGEENICEYPECSIDPCLYHLGEFSFVNGDTTINTCVKGSAGATAPIFSFYEDFTNPKVTNNENGNVLEYNGSIASGEYLIIYLDSTINGEVQDMTIETNITGFSATDITINNDGYFQLVNGNNGLLVQGGTSSLSNFGVNFYNRYHN